MERKSMEMHGGSHHPEYRVWSSAKERCFNPDHSRYEGYGGRGISMCQKWSESYQAFIDDMGRRPSSSHTLDRINCDGDYTPSNCRWATYTEQNRNRRGYNCLIEYRGQMMTRAELSRLTGVAHCTIRDRLASGRTVEESVFKGRLKSRRVCSKKSIPLHPEESK